MSRPAACLSAQLLQVAKNKCGSTTHSSFVIPSPPPTMASAPAPEPLWKRAMRHITAQPGVQGGAGALPPATQTFAPPPEPMILDEDADAVVMSSKKQKKRRTKRQKVEPLLTQEQRDAVIAKSRMPHSGQLKVPLSIAMLVATMALLGVTLWLFFRNMARARRMVQQQLVAERTSAVIATQLQSLLPAAKAPTSAATAAASSSSSSNKTPVATVASGSALWTELASVDIMGKLVNGDKVGVWVVDTNGFVYADSTHNAAAVASSTNTRPHNNLFDLATVAVEGSALQPTSVGEAVLKAAAHGAGLVSFNIPATSTGNGTTRRVEMYVRPIPGTDFLVATEVSPDDETL